jgi:acetyl-CoA C-acetyltransferase
MRAAIDPRTPAIVGVGQSSERIDDPDYRRMSAVELAAQAARAALRDCGADVSAAARRIDTVAGVRQFEISTPWASASALLRRRRQQLLDARDRRDGARNA